MSALALLKEIDHMLNTWLAAGGGTNHKVATPLAEFTCIFGLMKTWALHNLAALVR